MSITITILANNNNNYYYYCCCYYFNLQRYRAENVNQARIFAQSIILITTRQHENSSDAKIKFYPPESLVA